MLDTSNIWARASVVGARCTYLPIPGARQHGATRPDPAHRGSAMSGYIWANMWQYIGRPETRLGCRSRQASSVHIRTGVVLCCAASSGSAATTTMAIEHSKAQHRTAAEQKRQWRGRQSALLQREKKYLKFVFISFARTYFEFDSKSILLLLFCFFDRLRTHHRQQLAAPGASRFA